MEKRYFGQHHCFHRVARPLPAFNNGEQHIFRFYNGYGASLVRHAYSYGGPQGLWELAVIRFHGRMNDQWGLCYTTPITSDVVGYLTANDVADLLQKIKKL